MYSMVESSDCGTSDPTVLNAKAIQCCGQPQNMTMSSHTTSLRRSSIGEQCAREHDEPGLRRRDAKPPKRPLSVVAATNLRSKTDSRTSFS
jgi:hypothetical protein